MIDNIWAQWQAQDEARLNDVAGFYDTAKEPLSGWRNTSAYLRGLSVPSLLSLTSSTILTALDTVLDYQGIIPRLTIGDVMDTKGDVVCSVYE